MKTTSIVLLVLAAIFGVFILIAAVGGLTVIGMYNTEVKLETTYEAKIDANRAELDNVKKKISQVAQVSQDQLNQLDKIFTDSAAARTGNDAGAVVKWEQEAVPNIDQSTFKKIQDVIVSSRDAWTSRQTELVDISREYNQNLATFPGNVVLSMLGFKHIDPKIVTSTSTEKAFDTGKDDDTDVFQKPR